MCHDLSKLTDDELDAAISDARDSYGSVEYGGNTCTTETAFDFLTRMQAEIDALLAESARRSKATA